MTRVRVDGFTISLDGFGAGPNQDMENPLGVGGTGLHQWLLPTRTFQQTLFGADGGTTGIDDEFAARGFRNVGAWILGRNMFGPIRGAWPDMNWKGWWGDKPPYHVPTFILTHHARPPIEMEGGTTFYFVTGGIHEALDRARDAANGMDVRIGGGPATIQQYLRAGLVDDMHFAISPVLLGTGERLFEGLDMRTLGYECVQFVASEKATHVVLRREGHKGIDTESDEEQIRALLGRWASTTREGKLDEVLTNHSPDVLIYDVLPPMKYEGSEVYRKSWGDWQPETPSEGQFELEDLSITAGDTVAFAHAFIRCGGVLPNGKRFEDLVRATFCLGKRDRRWEVKHQHISKPFTPRPSNA